LTELGSLEKEEPYTNNVGFSERADVPIEPRLSEQWFLKYPSVEKSRACVEQAEVGLAVPSEPRRGGDTAPYQKMRFHPQRWAKVYDHWMENIKDWCISRQLWWGHRIPVWHKRINIKPGDDEELMCWGWAGFLDGWWEKKKPTDPLLFVRAFRVSDGKEVDPKKESLLPVTQANAGEYDFFACTDSDEKGKDFEVYGFTQDPDVLDTWFSSWLWPFATMGWPEQTPTLKAFYPTTDLVTGPDIIFFWVARMIMAGYEFMGELPFQNVYFTG